MQESNRFDHWHTRLRRNLILSTIGILVWAALVLVAGWLYIRFTGIDVFRTPLGRPLGVAALAPIVLTIVMQRKWLHCPHCGSRLEVQMFHVPTHCQACGTEFAPE